MSNYPATSYQNLDGVQDTSYKERIVIVGQSNTATAGLYKNIELMSSKEIDTLFGKSSQIGRSLRDANSMLTGFVKPSIYAVSYADKSNAVARTLQTTITGNAIKSFTQKIKIHSLDPFNLSVQTAVAHAMRHTKGCACASVSQNGAVTVGLPANAAQNFNAPLPQAKTNDVYVNVEIAKNETPAQIAAKVVAAVNANAYSVYSAASSGAVITFTSKHKGEIGQFFSVEFIPYSSATGVSYETLENIAGSGSVDISTMLTNVLDETETPLGELDFNYLVVPYSYNIDALKTDAYAKWENVYNYRGRALDYIIFQATALDLTDNTELNALAVDNPTSEEGIVRHLMVLSKETNSVIRLVKPSKIAIVESKQFTPITEEQDGKATVGNSFTLSDSAGFIDLSRVLSSSIVRAFIIEKRIPEQFQEKSFTTGSVVQGFMKNTGEIIADFKETRDIVDGTNQNTVWGTMFAGLVSNSSTARAVFDELLEATTSFSNKTVFVNIVNELLNPIQNISITATNN
jgi:hypothetical protein